MFPTRVLLGNPVKKYWSSGLLWKPQKWGKTRKRNWQARMEGARDVEAVLRRAAGDQRRVDGQVRGTPCRPRSWANLSLLSRYHHRNAWANLHILGQPASSRWAKLTAFSLQLKKRLGEKSRALHTAPSRAFASAAGAGRASYSVLTVTVS